MSEENHNKRNDFKEKNYHSSNQQKNGLDISENKNSFYPWIKTNSKCNFFKGILKLHYEILDFYEFIKLTDEEIALRNKTYNEIKDIIEDNFPNYKCSLYGSFITGLSLPNSDIDILITEKENSNKTQSTQSESDIDNKGEKCLLNNMEKIYSILKNKNIFKNLEMINAKVPIITGLYYSTQIHVDISLYKKNGVNAAEIINKAISIYPEIKPLMLIIKYLIRQRNLNQIYTGGISSFIIFTLLYYYIVDLRKQIENEIKNGQKERTLTLGHLLIGFFNFYAFQFKYEKFGISISNGCYLYKREVESKNILSVKSFEDESLDMGINCFNYGKIRDVFKLAAERLNYSEKNIVSYLKEFIFPDDILKKRANMISNKNKNDN